MVAAVSWMFDLLPLKIHIIFKALLQIFINVGILLIAVFSIDQIRGDFWTFPYLVQFVVTVIGLVAAFYLPESHVYNYTIHRSYTDLSKSLQLLRGEGYNPAEVDDVISKIDTSSNVKQMSLRSFLKDRRFRIPLITTILMNMFQQISGINVVVAFTSELLTGGQGRKIDVTGQEISLKKSDIDKHAEFSIYILIIGVVGSLIAAPFVGRFRRKVMLMVGFGGMTVFFLVSNFVDAYSKNKPTLITMYSMVLFIFQFGPGMLCC